MLIKRVSVSGWRSFNPGHAVEVEELGLVNLVIGPNNVGKSNLGRFLVRVRDILLKKGCSVATAWSNSTEYGAPLAYEFEIDEIDHWLREDHPVAAEIDLEAHTLRAPQSIPDWILNNGSLRCKVSLVKSDHKGILSIVPLAANSLPLITKTNSTFLLLLRDARRTEQVSGNAAHWYRALALAACGVLAESIVEIKPLRDPARQAGQQNPGSTDGGDVVASLRSAQIDKNKQSFWTRCKSDLESWLAILLGESEVRIEINESGFWIEVRRGTGRFRCALPDLGAGVSEIVMVLAYLRLCPDHPLLVVIDEPEAHLHPAAVVELIRIITTNLPNHQLLITTHSTALIDAVTPTWRTFRARRADHGGTSFDVLGTTRDELSLLSDLGIRPSQMFLARVVIWVEGPSDVHFMTALLHEVDSSLIAGRDFAFVTYGGASSSHLDLEVEVEVEVEAADEDSKDEVTNRIVKVLKVAHRSIIVCDRDRPQGESERALVERLSAAAARLPTHARVETSFGREIENGVKEEILLRALVEVRPKRFNRPTKIKLTYVDYAVGANDSFDEVVSRAARGEKGEQLSDELIARVKERLEQQKTRIADRIREIGLAEPVFRPEVVGSGQALVRWMRGE